jgi:hypothetical protein
MTSNGTDTSQDAPPVDVQRLLIQQDRQLWINTRYQMEIRLRVRRRNDPDTEIEALLIKELERCEKMITGYDQELAALA